MADHWRYQDRVAPGQLLTKRPISELSDVLLHGSAGYGRADPRFHERDYVLDYGKAGAAYGSVGLTGGDITGLADGTLLGAGVTGSLRAPTLGLSALEDPRLAGVTGSLRAPTLGLSALEDPRIAGVTGSLRAPTLGLSALEFPPLAGVESGLLKGAGVGLNGARSDILSGQDVPGAGPGLDSLQSEASPTLFVEGLPVDCSRRETSHIFRPFHGYKEVRWVLKGSKRKGFVFCFVDFEDAHSAAKALEALQGYKLDQHEGDSVALRLHFARNTVPHTSGRPERQRRRRLRKKGKLPKLPKKRMKRRH